MDSPIKSIAELEYGLHVPDAVLVFGGDSDMRNMVNGRRAGQGAFGLRIAVPKEIRAEALKALAKVHPRFFTPYIAIAFYASLGLLLAISGGFKQLATIASASLLIIYLGVVLSSVKLRRKNTATTEKTFRVPGGIIVPLLAAAGIIWLLSNLTRRELIGVGLFILVFSIIYFTMKQVKKKN